MKKNIFFLFAALLTGGLLVSCSSDDTDDEKSYGGYEKKNYRLEVQANNGVGTRTLIYDANQNTITPSWTEGEEVGVHTFYEDDGYLTPIHLGFVKSNHTGNPTTLVGDIPQLSGYKNIQKGSQLIFTFPNSSQSGGDFNYYDGQDGTLETIASNFDYASATAEVEDFLKEPEGDKLYIQLKGGNHLNFINHTSITAFSFKDEEGNTLVPATFMISGQGLVKEYNVITDEYQCFLGANEEPSAENGKCLTVPVVNELKTIYVAMLNKNSQKTTYTLYLSARKEGSSELLSYKCRMSANLQPGKYYSTTVKMKKVKNWSDAI